MADQTPKASGPTGQPHDQIAEDHHNLRQALAHIGTITDIAVLLPALEKLYRALEDHFALEEAADGLTQTIGDSAPHHLNRLDRLFEEHKTLLGTLSGIMQKGRTCLDGPVAEVLGDVKSLSDALHAHEVTETELLTDAVYTDLGTSG